MFERRCHTPDRVRLPLALTHAPQSLVMLMPGWNQEFFGLKVVTSLPENRALAKPSLTATYFLFRLDDGECIASFDGDELTTRRTVATSALAMRKLARPDARRLLVLGGGRIASQVPFCFQHVAHLDQIRIWSRNPEQAARIAETCRAAGLCATVEMDHRRGIRWADVISAATPSTEPLIEDKDVRPGTHIDLIGSFTPAMREADAALIERACLFVDAGTACTESGDLLQASAEARESVVALSALLDRSRPGRTSPEDVTVFKSVGHALQDFVAAELLYKQRVPAFTGP
jgi:ornithine cyclodeaminase